MKKVFVIDEKDNVGTNVLDVISKGEQVGTNGRISDVVVTANQDVPYGHKVALKPIAKGETVWKYGLSIGSALTDIQPGDHVHVHNVESNRGRGDRAAAQSGSTKYHG